MCQFSIHLPLSVSKDDFFLLEQCDRAGYIRPCQFAPSSSCIFRPTCPTAAKAVPKCRSAVFAPVVYMGMEKIWLEKIGQSNIAQIFLDQFTEFTQVNSPSFFRTILRNVCSERNLGTKYVDVTHLLCFHIIRFCSWNVFFSQNLRSRRTTSMEDFWWQAVHTTPLLLKTLCHPHNSKNNVDVCNCTSGRCARM